MFKLFLLLWCLGLPGIVAVSWLVLPLLFEGRALPVPPHVVSMVSALQSSVLLALAAGVGVRLAPALGLQAPFLSTLAKGKPSLWVLREQLLPGLVGGLLGAAVLFASARFAPDALAAVQDRFSMPLAARLLYGGITEEILMRWGLMTLLLSAGWHLVQRGAGKPSAMLVWAAILITALLFGALHLPIAAQMLGGLSDGVIWYVVLANASFGIVAGYLYWKYGLEAAIIAHLTAHAVGAVVAG